MATYAIVGTGGHGRETMAMARRMPALQAEGVELVFVDREVAQPRVNGFKVITTQEFLGLPGSKYFNPAIASSVIRRRVAGEMSKAGVPVFSVFAENFYQLDHNVIGEGAIFSPFTTVTVNVTIGTFFHANNYAYVSHDCKIGDFVTFAPGVKCNGNVVIKDDAYIGTGAIIRQGTPDAPLVIGEGAVVGMGAVVTRNVEDGMTVIGNPARRMNSAI